MASKHKPLLSFGPQIVGKRPKKNQFVPRIVTPSVTRQGARLSPQFRDLAAAIGTKRASLFDNVPDEIDPALVVVFDLASNVKDFQNAIETIDDLEFLSEFLGDATAPDDDFYHQDQSGNPTDKSVQHSLYMVMSNAKAIQEIIRLFNLWQEDPNVSFKHGLAKFKSAFSQLTAIRRWGPQDRIRETGLLEKWREKLDLIGESHSTVTVEVELWFRKHRAQRKAAESHVRQIIASSGGRILNRSEIGDIGYHALLAELPIQQVRTVLQEGAAAIHLLASDDVMFVSPFIPMSISPGTLDPVTKIRMTAGDRVGGVPRIALLDGMPFQNHDALAGRLVIDDPDGVAENYPVAARNHGTAMASLIIHGDLSSPGEPLAQPLYVRPILQAHEFAQGTEVAVTDQLLTDLLHRAIRRIKEGEGGRPATAESVRVINLAIGAESRTLTWRMSPVGRLLDWLAQEYNLLFVVSAGNHTAPIIVPATSATEADEAKISATRATYDSGILRGILPPGDALNALTIGATHEDEMGTIKLPDTVWDINDVAAPAFYSATGPGIERSIKPDFLHSGGRALYSRPVVAPGEKSVELSLRHAGGVGPGHQVAAPGSGGATNNTAFTFGTSNATALVTREASHLFEILEADATTGLRMPDALFHPLLVRALLAHSSSWGGLGAWYKSEFDLGLQESKSQITSRFGYGRLDTNRLGTAAANRAVVISGGHITVDERHTYELPLPPSLRSRAEWHRFTITLAYFVPTVGRLKQYRGAKVYFDTPDMKLAAGKRINTDHHAVRRGSLQHEIIEGTQAMVFGENETFPIHIECMDAAQRLKRNESIRYALVVSVETTQEVSTTIHDEVRTALQIQARQRSRQQVTGTLF